MEFFRINGGLRGEGGVREGNRGGLGLFKWEDIKTDTHKECYLGNSVKASTGRWQRHKNLHWFLQEKQEHNDQVDLDELAEIKRLEAAAMAEALGVQPVEMDDEQAQAVKEDIKKELVGKVHEEKVVGLGYQGSKRRDFEKQYKREYHQKEYESRKSRDRAKESGERSLDKDRHSRSHRDERKSRSRSRTRSRDRKDHGRERSHRRSDSRERSHRRSDSRERSHKKSDSREKNRRSRDRSTSRDRYKSSRRSDSRDRHR